MHACYFDSQSPVATWSGALSRCDMSLKTVTTSWMRAQAGVKQTSTTGQQKKKGSRVQAETRITEIPKMPLAEAGRKGKLFISTSQDTGCLGIDSHLLDTCLHQTQRAGKLSTWLATHGTRDNQKTSIATCVATSQRLAVTTEQTIADD